MAPWATERMRTERGAQIETMITQAKNCGGCEDIVVSLEKELKVFQKVPKQPPLLNRIENTRVYVERAGKRLENLAAQRIEIEKQEAAAEKEMEEAKERLEAMEIEARTDLVGAVPELASAASTLEDAVRTLLVSLHPCQLPTQANEAAQAIMSLLPVTEVSADVEDVALDALIPTNQTDVEMSWAKRQLEKVGESDEAILTWAKRVKASARTTPY